MMTLKMMTVVFMLQDVLSKRVIWVKLTLVWFELVWVIFLRHLWGCFSMKRKTMLWFIIGVVITKWIECVFVQVTQVKWKICRRKIWELWNLKTLLDKELKVFLEFSWSDTSVIPLKLCARGKVTSTEVTVLFE